MADDLDDWLASLPDKLAEALADEFADAVEEELVQPIKEAAPQGPTGNTKESVRKEPGSDQFEWVVQAGGPLTTKLIRVAASSVTYDYALGLEFGNSHMPAQPFFWPTIRVQYSSFQDRCDDMLDRAMQKVGD